MKRFACLVILIAASLPGTAQAGAREDWARITAMDAGPQKKPASREEAVLFAKNHLAAQRRLVEAYLAAYPRDPHTFDARLRLAAILAAEGKMDGNPEKVAEALRMYAALESSPEATAVQRADAGFRRVSLVMQNQSGSPEQTRDAVVRAARTYTATYPGDRRGPRLLVEAATLCDAVPTQKRDLLEEALRLTDEPALKQRIADDFRRLDFLGRTVDLRISSVDGGTIDLAKLRGKVVVVIFWSAESPHSLLWLQKFRAAWQSLPQKDVRVVTVSLDENRRLLDDKLRALQTDWPTHFDSRGWEGATVRKLGINAVPTVWIFDRKGVLRTLNARDDYEAWIRRLAAE